LSTTTRQAPAAAMQWASAVADAPVLETAVTDAAQAVARTLGAATADLLIAFVSPHHAAHFRDLPRLLRTALPHEVLLGCSAGGVIGGGREVEERPGLALTAARLPGVTATPIALTSEDLPDSDAGPRAWHEAIGIPPEPRPHFILLADPFSIPAEDLLAGLDFAYPSSQKVGGLASAARRPGENALYLADRILNAGAVGVALSGNIELDTVVAQGCRPVGKPMQITRADRNVLLELDGQSPLKAVVEMLNGLAPADQKLAQQALLLGIVMDNMISTPGPGDFLIRNIIGVDRERGLLAIGEVLREGQIVQFHLRDAKTAAEDLSGILSRYAMEETSGAARGALLFSCLGRGAHLYGRPDHDTDLFRTALGGLPLGGFFCNGEIGPVGGITRLHGFTSSFGIFRPASEVAK
jgi:small ligand-binding sensory domain FIST